MLTNIRVSPSLLFTVGYYALSVPSPPDRQRMLQEDGRGHVCKGLCQLIFPSYGWSSAPLRVTCRPQAFEAVPASVWVAHGLQRGPSGVPPLLCHGASPSETASPALPSWAFSAASPAPSSCCPSRGAVRSLTGGSFGA